MKGLLTHCGANAVEREQVMTAIAPPSTDTWHPITHGTLLDLAIDSMTAANLSIVNEAHAMTPNHKRYFGLFEISSLAEDYNMVIGFRNSTDKAFGAGVVAGSSVFVCDNLCFSGEVVIKRRHTINIMEDLPGLVNDAIYQTTKYQETLETQIRSYKETDITNRMAEHAIIEMVRRNVVTTQRVVKVVKEWDTPRHPEFAESHNVWRLFNAVTEANKGVQLADPNKDFRLNTLMGELVKEAA